MSPWCRRRRRGYGRGPSQRPPRDGVWQECQRSAWDRCRSPFSYARLLQWELVLGLWPLSFPADVLGCLELKRGVIDVEVGREAAAEMIEDIPGHAVCIEQDVGRDDVHAARDRPGVEVVHLGHPGCFQDVTPNLVIGTPLASLPEARVVRSW